MANNIDISYSYYVFDTSLVADNKTITLQNERRGDVTTWDGITDWGDGTQDTKLSHTYTTDGIYTVKTKWCVCNTNGTWDTSDNYDENTRISLTEVKNINKNCTNYKWLFHNKYGNTNENLNKVTIYDTSNVIDMYTVFYNCNSLTSLDVSNWDTSKVTNMQTLFRNCNSLTSLDVSNWDTSNVTNMYYMFNGCSGLTSLDVSKWDTSKVTTMEYMFKECSGLTSLDISNWDTSNVTNMSGMFRECYGLSSLDISNWDTSKVTSILYMFNNCTNLSNIKCNNASTISKLSSLLPTRTSTSKGTLRTSATLYTNTLSTLSSKYWDVIDTNYNYFVFDTSLSTNGRQIILYNDNRRGDTTEYDGITDWGDGTKNTELTHTYTTNGRFTVKTKWVPNAISDNFNAYGQNTKPTKQCLIKCININKNMTNLAYILSYSAISNFDCEITNNVTIVSGLFENCVNLINIDCAKIDTSNITDINDMFHSCIKLKSLDLNAWDASKFETVHGMFCNCQQLTSLNINEWDTRSLTRLYNLFYNCNNLTSVDVSNWDTSKVTIMYCMFFNCINLTSLDISNWNTSKVTNMDSLFYNCNSLTSLDIGKWDTSKVTNMINMFNGCNNLSNIKCNNASTISKISSLLPTRTSTSKGTLRSYANIDDETKSTLSGKYWDLYLTYNPETLSQRSWNIIDSTYNYFIFDTTKVEGNTTIILQDDRRGDGTEWDGITDWGDGTQDTELSHTYDEDGIYTVKTKWCIQRQDNINGDTTNDNNTRISLIKVKNTNKNITSLYKMFMKCTNLNSVQRINVNKKCVNLGWMFRNCTSLTSLDVSDWDISNVIDIGWIFSNCNKLNSIIGIENLNTSKVTIFSATFENTIIEKLDLNKWDISSATTLLVMFNNCIKLTSLDVGDWDISNIINTNSMFNNCNKLTSLDVSDWDTSNVIDMYCMFSGCTKLTQLDVSNWDTSNVTNMSYTFNNCQNLTSLDVGDWDTSNVTTFDSTFKNCINLQTLDVSKWNISNVTSFAYMFSGCNNLTSLDINYSNSHNITSAYRMFEGCSSLTSLDLHDFDFSNITIIDNFTTGCTNLKSLNVRNFKITSTISNYSSFIYNCPNLTSLIIDDVNTLKLLTTMLPDRTEDNPGYVVINNTCDDNTIPALSNKHWNIVNDDSVFNIFKVKIDDHPIESEIILQNTLRGDTTVGSGLTDWGDGCVDAELRHTYKDNGIYTIKTKYWFNDENGNGDYDTLISITDILNINKNITTLKYGFANLPNLTKLDLSKMDLQNVTNVECMCYSCTNLKKVNLDGINFANITSLHSLFNYCTSLTSLDVSNWDTSNVTNMYRMFKNCIKLTSIDLSNWDISNVTNISSLFESCYNLSSIDVSNWDTINVTDMSWSFSNCNNLASLDIDDWDVSKVTNMYAMFSGCNYLTSLDVSNWDTSKVTNMSYMFYNCTSLTSLDIGNWDISNVTNMCYMFRNCNSLTSLDLNNWNTSNVTNMADMFRDCRNLTSIYINNWDTGKVTNMGELFYNCQKLKYIDVSNFDTSKVNNMANMFYSCTSLTSLDVSNFDTSKVTDLKYIFQYCQRIEVLDVSKWDVSNVKNMAYAFEGCLKIKELDVSKWDTSNVTDMGYMFDTCIKLASLDVSDWDVSNVTRLSSMFNTCSELTSLDLSNWNVNTESKLNYILEYSDNLKSLSIQKDLLLRIYNDLPTQNSLCYVDCEEDGIDSNILESLYNKNYLLIDKDYNYYKIEIMNDNTLFTLQNDKRGDETDWDGITNWGDGYKNTELSHTYNEGTYIIKTKYSLVSSNGYHSNTNIEVNYLDHYVNRNITNFANLENVAKCWEYDYYVENVIIQDNMNITDSACWAFDNVDNIVGLDKLNTSEVTDMTGLFYCVQMKHIDLSNFDTSKVTNMSCMFAGTESHILDVSNFDTSMVVNMESMFEESKVCKIIGIEDFNTSDVLDMNSMFRGSFLKSLDLSKWDINSATDMSEMFEYIELYCNLSTKIKNYNNPCFNSDRLELINPINVNSITGHIKELILTGTVDNVNIGINEFNFDDYIVNYIDTLNISNIQISDDSLKSLLTIELSDDDIIPEDKLISKLIVKNKDLLTQIKSMLSTVSSNNKPIFKYILSTYIDDIDKAFFEEHGITLIDMEYNIFNKYININENPTMVLVDDRRGDETEWDGMTDWGDGTVNNELSHTYSSTGYYKIKTKYWIESYIDYLEEAQLYNVPQLLSLNTNMTDYSHFFDYVKMDIRMMYMNNSNCDISYMFSNFMQIESFDLTPYVNSILNNKISNIVGAFKDCNYKFNYIMCVLDNITDYSHSFDNCNASDISLLLNCMKNYEFNMNNCFSNLNAEYIDMYVENPYNKNIKIESENICYKSNIYEFSVMDMNENVDNITFNNPKNAFYGNYNLSDLYFVRHVTGSMKNMFYGCTELRNIEGIDTSEVTDMSGLFYNCKNLEINLDLDTSKVTDMSYMFSECKLQSLDVSNWDTSNVTDMSYMFSECSNLTDLDVSNWDTSNVTDMSYMFNECQKLTSIDVSNWDTSKVTNLDFIFSRCYAFTELNVSNWDTSKVTNMSHVFFCSNLESLDVSKWNTSKVTDMNSMFSGCNNLTSLDVNNFDTSNVINMTAMFNNCSKLTTIDVSNFDTSKVTNMSYMFSNNGKLSSLNLNNFNTVNVTDMSYMFLSCPSLTSSPVGHFDTSSLNDASYMFDKCTSLTSVDLTDWKFNDILNKDYIVNNTNCDLILNNLYITNKTSFGNIVSKSIDLTGATLDPSLTDLSEKFTSMTKSYIGLNDLDVSNVTNLYKTFYNCKNLESIDLTGWDVSNVTSMEYMFGECQKLVNANLTGWNTSNVTTMRYMFSDCYLLKYLDTRDWDMSKVTTVDRMFFYCKVIETIDGINDWNVTSLQDIDGIFIYCFKLKGIDFTNWVKYKPKFTDIGNIYNCATADAYVGDWSDFDVTEAVFLAALASKGNFDARFIKKWKTNDILVNISYMFYGYSGSQDLDISGLNLNGSYVLASMFDSCKVTKFYGFGRQTINNQNKTNISVNNMFRYCTIPKICVQNVSFEYISVSNAAYDFAELFRSDSIKYLNVKLDNKAPLSSNFFRGNAFDTLIINDIKYNAFDNLKGNETLIPNLKKLAFKNCNVKYALPLLKQIANGSNGNLELYINAMYEPSDVRVGKVYDTLYNYFIVKLNENTSRTITLVDNMRGDITEWNGMTDWGDGTIDAELTHTYDLYGEYEIKTKYSINDYDGTGIPELYKVKAVNKNITNMKNMFNGCSNLIEVEPCGFNTLKVTNMENAFRGTGLTDISLDGLDTENVTNMNYMLAETPLVDVDLTSLKTHNTITMEGLLYGCDKMTSIHGVNFPTDKMENMSHLFDGCTSLVDFYMYNLEFRGKVNDMFANCSKLENVDGIPTDISNVTDISRFFLGCKVLNTKTLLTVTEWDISNNNNLTSFEGLFEYCENLEKVDFSSWDITGIDNMSFMFAGCKKLTSVNLTGWAFARNIKGMFYGCEALTTITLNDCNMDNVSNIEYLYGKCYSLVNVKPSLLNVYNCTSLKGVFAECRSIVTLDLSTFDTRRIVDMSNMLAGCTALRTLNINNSNFIINSNTNVTDMMKGCTYLKNVSNIYMNNCNDETKARIQNIANSII